MLNEIESLSDSKGSAMTITAASRMAGFFQRVAVAGKKFARAASGWLWVTRKLGCELS